LGREDEAAECEREAERIAAGVEAVPEARVEPSARIYGVINGLASDTVDVLAADEREAWFAYRDGLGATRLVFRGRRFQTFTQGDELTSDVVKCIALTEEAAWLGTDQGLSRFDRESQEWTHFTSETGLKANVVNDIVPDGELLWLGTESGLLVLDTGSGRSAVCPGGPEPSTIDCLLADENRIWCGADEENAGISVFTKQAETFEQLDVGPWVRGMQVFPRRASRRLWAARKDGIAIVDRATYAVEDVPLPDVQVTDIAVGVYDLLLGTVQGLATVDREQAAAPDVEVAQTDIGRGQCVTAVSGTRTKEWIAIEGEGVLCLSYS
jgi:ligand-binding sensor domain-containing protein